MASADFLIPRTFTNGIPGMLSDAVDFASGEYLTIEGYFDPTDAAVLTALRTVRGSGSAVEDVGQRLHDQPLMTPSLPSFIRGEVAYALRQVIALRQIQLDGVDVDDLGDGVDIAVRYVNLARQQERVAATSLSQIVSR